MVTIACTTVPTMAGMAWPAEYHAIPYPTTLLLLCYLAMMAAAAIMLVAAAD